MSGVADLALIGALLLAGAAALGALPWTDREILHVHRVAAQLARAARRRSRSLS